MTTKKKVKEQRLPDFSMETTKDLITVGVSKIDDVISTKISGLEYVKTLDDLMTLRDLISATIDNVAYFTPDKTCCDCNNEHSECEDCNIGPCYLG